MEELRLQEAVHRIESMERCFDTLQTAFAAAPAAFGENDTLKALLQSLTQYYEGGLWLSDYQLDEQGLLPEGMKRGVLAQDAVYDFLGEIKFHLPPEAQDSATEK